LEIEQLEDRSVPGSVLNTSSVIPPLDLPDSLQISTAPVLDAVQHAGRKVDSLQLKFEHKSEPVPFYEETSHQVLHGTASTQPSPAVNGDSADQLAGVVATIQPGLQPTFQAIAAASVRPLLTVTVTIDKPKANSSVSGCGSFATFGYVSPVDASMSAWVTDGSNQYNGTAITPVPHIPRYQWGFSFTGVPTGHSVTLTVQGTESGNVGSQSISITLTCP
jgi:hypothetical protein